MVAALELAAPAAVAPPTPGPGDGAVQQEVQLDFFDISFSVPAKQSGAPARNILQGVQGGLRPRRLTAVLGPSGAGKTTLLNILSGNRRTGVRGQVLVNGRDCPLATVRHQSVYVPQDVDLLDQLTVRETLRVAADLKLGKRQAAKDRAKVVLDIASTLGLETCLDTFASRLSGGERKRLSIGVELVTNPPVMFFDEPTSGLDSVSSLQVVSHLRSLSRAGRTIAVVLHQPSSRLFQLFDDVLVLGGGRTLYYGPAAAAAPAFSAAGFVCPTFYNIADYVVEVASGEHQDPNQPLPVVKIDNLHVDLLDADHKDSSRDSDPMLPSGIPLRSDKDAIIQVDTKLPRIVKASARQCRHIYPVSCWEQFAVLFKRSLLVSWRDRNMAWLRFAAHVGVALMLGCLFRGVGSEASKVPGNVACLFFFVLFLFFSNAMPTVLTFPLEAAVFYREYSNNWYSLSSYYLSKMLADLPFMIINPTVFLMVAYYLTDQPDEHHRRFMIWLICLLTVLVAHAYGLVVGAAMGMQLGVFLVPASTIPLILFSGFFLYLPDIPAALYWLSYVSNFRYSFEGAVVSVFGMQRKTIKCSLPYCHWKNPHKFLSEIGMEKADYWFDVTGLVMWFVLLQVSLLVTLKVRVYLKRR